MEETKTIEILFPEFCNLYGDISNMQYLRKCMPEANFIETAFDEEPTFVKGHVDMIYLGPMTERMQEKVIRKLQIYRERIQELIEENVVFLLTGNAMEILGEYIQKEDGSQIEALKLFPIYSKRDMMHRHNSHFIGKFEDIDIVGFKSQFSMSYGDNEKNYFATVEKGIGLNSQSKLEGIRKNNLVATYVIGPILILNPLFTKKIIEMMGVRTPKIALAEDVMLAYQQRLKEFRSL
ncbi:MAG: hypothetical protein ACLU84_06500 [Clostridia bacterium]